MNNTISCKLSKQRVYLLLSLGLVLLLGIFAVGCGNSQVSGAAGDSNTLTISVVTKGMYLDAAVQKFEELHPGVTVKVEEYTSNPLSAPSGGKNQGMALRNEDPADIEKYLTAMNAQLMTGQGSDIMLLNYLPYETYADKNLLTDIGQLMESDPDFDLSKYYRNILEALKYKGSLYGLPVGFSVDMMATDKSLLADAQVEIEDGTWNWQDFVQAAEKVIQERNGGDDGEIYALAGMNETMLITALVRENFSKLVDREKREAYFDGQDFLDLLNLCQYLIDHNLLNTEPNQNKAMELAARGNLVFNITSLKGLINLQTLKASMGGEVQLLKPPGNGGNLTFSTDALYGINSNSVNQELAWEFLKLLVSDEMMSQSMFLGMPINKSVVPEMIRQANDIAQKGGAKIMMKSAGESQAQNITLQPLAQEDIDFVESLLTKANVYNGANQKILAIVQEETAAFFTGQKSAEMTAKLIQDRVNTYLHE
ncbi:ABC transporter substrate-binding protein [Desulfitobacterium chlororespirans]|uniref:Carbohydrate ABC transporter substrate-binding protein, CUT1 family n=1 Tax=Desulfitobacterium chlororespirans DSM 11544 TaxID=1121395 RepID=A0A1M7TW13_9FIRM|nr:extracellular solute-binding protein [Desulfitobacterium chlororespirans]SHN74916.1 carbohydrate ABC transporter substrate-binding protein, CUT1 family [Desulfitobacterium chlororespirans DSM 11544]